LFDRYKRLELQWYLSFDIKPINRYTHQSNIIHMTVGGNYRNYGSRTPFVEFQRSSTRIVVCSALNRNRNYCWTSSRELPLNVFSNIQIRQTWDTSRKVYVFYVFINGRNEFNTVNSSPAEFDSVILYTSSPWYHPAQAMVKNLVFQNLPNGLYNS